MAHSKLLMTCCDKDVVGSMVANFEWGGVVSGDDPNIGADNLFLKLDVGGRAGVDVGTVGWLDKTAMGK